jgi:hypothetical protein
VKAISQLTQIGVLGFPVRGQLKWRLAGGQEQQTDQLTAWFSRRCGWCPEADVLLPHKPSLDPWLAVFLNPSSSSIL